jgi:hypothetical protein
MSGAERGVKEDRGGSSRENRKVHVQLAVLHHFELQL